VKDAQSSGTGAMTASRRIAAALSLGGRMPCSDNWMIWFNAAKLSNRCRLRREMVA
jgi:hypothetical protein